MTAKIGFILLAAVCCAGEQKSDQLLGRWKVSAIVNFSPVTAMNGATAEHLIGRSLILKPRAAQFAGRTCKATYEENRETALEFFQDYKLDLKTLNLPDPVRRFDGGCTEIFFVVPGKIIFTWKGYFLEATKDCLK